MPWKERSIVEERMRFVLRLKDGESMASLCREFGISGVTGYKIYDRYKERQVLLDKYCNALLMLGPTDESHLIRTVEYWDIELRKWPGASAGRKESREMNWSHLETSLDGLGETRSAAHSVSRPEGML